jgi:hypothetical protein
MHPNDDRQFDFPASASGGERMTHTPTPAEVAARLRDILDQIAFEHSRECSPTMPPLWTRLGAKRAILHQVIDNNAEQIAAWLEDYAELLDESLCVRCAVSDHTFHATKGSKSCLYHRQSSDFCACGVQP